MVLTTWVGGGAGLDADLAAEATPVERGMQLSTRLCCVHGEVGAFLDLAGRPDHPLVHLCLTGATRRPLHVPTAGTRPGTSPGFMFGI